MSQKPNPLLQFAHRPWAIPLGLFVFALALRLLGIGWGLKNDLHDQSYHPDELDIWAMSQNIEPARAKFTPGRYNYPTLYLTALRVASDVVGVYGGRPEPKDRSMQWDYISRCHLAGRVLSALAGALTVLFLFLLLRRRVNEVGAAMGALLVAVAPGHVVHSRFQTVDVAATCLLTVSLWFALRLLPCEGRGTGDEGEGIGEQGTGSRDSMRLALLAGAFAGLSAGTKYTGAVAILALAAVLLWKREQGWGKRLAAGLGACVAAFLVTTPGVVLDRAAFWRDFSFEMHHTATAHGLVFVGTPIGFVAHLVNLSVGIGPFLLILGAIGLVFGAVRRQPWIWALIAFAVPYYLLIGRAEVTFLRYTFPLYIPVAAGFGCLMGYAHEQRGRFVWLTMVGIAALGGIDPGGLRMAATTTVWMMGEDPRDSTARLLRGQDTTVGLVTDPWFYTPPFYADTALGPAGSAFILNQMQDAYAGAFEGAHWQTLPEAMFGVRDRLMREASRPRVLRNVPENWEARMDWDARLLTERKPEYVAFSNYEVGDVARLLGRKDVPHDAQHQANQADAFMKELNRAYDRMDVIGGTGFGVHDMDYIRPTIWLWKRKNK